MKVSSYLQPFILSLAVSACLTGAAHAEDAPLLRLDTGGHTGSVKAVLCAPNGRQLISTGFDKSVRIWDLLTPKVQALHFKSGAGEDGKVFSAAVSPDEKLPRVAIGTSGPQFEILIFDYAAGKQVGRVSGHKGAVTGLSYSPNGRRLASCAVDGTVRVWDLGTGKPVWKKDAGQTRDYISCIGYSPDGKYVAAGRWFPVAQGGIGAGLNVWDAETGKELHAWKWGREINCLTWSAGGVLAYGSSDGNVHLWDSEKDAEPRRITEQRDGIACLSFTPDGQTLLIGGGQVGSDCAVHEWSLQDNRLLPPEFKGHAITVFAVTALRDGRRAVSADAFGAMHLWDLRSGEEERSLSGSGVTAYPVAWSKDGKRVAWGTDIVIPTLRSSFDLSQAAPSGSVTNQDDWAQAQKSQGGLKVEVIRDAVIIRNDAGKEQGRIPANPGDSLLCATFVEDRKLVVGSEQYLSLWDISDPKKSKQVTLFEGHEGAIASVATSPDGKYLASSSTDQTIRIWKLDGAGPKTILPVLSIFQGTDGRWVAWNDTRGFYAASPAGDDIIGWQFNRGADQLAEFRSSRQCRAQFYRPDVVCRLVEEGGVSKALEVADMQRGKPTDAALVIQRQIAKIPQLEIVGVGPAQQQGDLWLADKQKVNLVIRLKDPDPTVRFRLKVNHPATSRLLKETTRGEKPGEYVLEASLLPDTNFISVVAVNDAGESEPQLARVQYNVPESEKKSPALYMVSIGINRYKDANVSPLQFADKDAEEMSAFFKGQQGKLFSKVEVQTLQNEGATVAEVNKKLDWLKASVGPRDYAILYVSSHGFADPATNSFYFAPHDVRLEDLTKTGIAWQKILETLNDISARNVVLILDNCFSGGVNKELIKQAQATPEPRGFKSGNEAFRALRESNLLTFTASSSTEVSWEDPAWQHGAFTLALLKALRGEVAQLISPDGTVALDWIAPYVRAEVGRMVAQLFKNAVLQRPMLYMLPDADPHIPLAKVK
jgi:WD40 repeat protein